MSLARDKLQATSDYPICHCWMIDSADELR